MATIAESFALTAKWRDQTGKVLTAHRREPASDVTPEELSESLLIMSSLLSDD